jgi:hypothetical protein
VWLGGGFRLRRGECGPRYCLGAFHCSPAQRSAIKALKLGPEIGPDSTELREWFSPSQPLIQSIPPVMPGDLPRDGLQRLRDDAEKPPVVGK